MSQIGSLIYGITHLYILFTFIMKDNALLCRYLNQHIKKQKMSEADRNFGAFTDALDDPQPMDIGEVRDLNPLKMI